MALLQPQSLRSHCLLEIQHWCMMGCDAMLADKVPFYISREIRRKYDGGQPIKESVSNAVGGLVYQTDKATLNKAAKTAIHEAVRTGIALQLLGQCET